MSELTGPNDTIDLTEAVTITTNWRNWVSTTTPSENYIRAFFIPIDDITSLAAFHDVEAVRAYIGLAVANDPSSAKLALVPVDDSGNDILSTKSGSSIYDFTQPCPQACDVNSPLFNGID